MLSQAQVMRYAPYAGLLLLSYHLLKIVKVFYENPTGSKPAHQNLLERILGDDVLLEKIVPGRVPIDAGARNIVEITARSAYRPQPN